MGMLKVEGAAGSQGSMGPPSLPFSAREDALDPMRRGVRPKSTTAAQPIAGGRKRKDRDSENEENGGIQSRKKNRG